MKSSFSRLSDYIGYLTFGCLIAFFYNCWLFVEEGGLSETKHSKRLFLIIGSLIGIGFTAFIDLMKDIAEMGGNLAEIKAELLKNAVGLNGLDGAKA